MTTIEIIKLIQSDLDLARDALIGVPDNKKDAFLSFYGINPEHRYSTIDMIAKKYHRNKNTISQWVEQVRVWLRGSSRISLFRAYLKEQHRQRHWFWRRWNWIVEHVGKNNKGHVQDQAKDVGGD